MEDCIPKLLYTDGIGGGTGGFVEGEFDNVDDVDINDYWINIMDEKIVYIRM